MSKEVFELSEVRTLLASIVMNVAKAATELAECKYDTGNSDPIMEEEDRQVAAIAREVAGTATAIANISHIIGSPAIDSASMRAYLTEMLKAILKTAAAASNIKTDNETPRLNISDIKDEMVEICTKLGIDPSELD